MARILIADDHDVVRSGIRRILEDQPGWSVVAEANQPRGRHAEAVATKPDVAIHEYALPVLNGIQATRQIRQRVPSVEVTMHATEDLLRELINAGARLRAEIRRPAAFDFCHPVAGSHKPFFTDRAPQKPPKQEELDQAGPDRPRANHRSNGRRGP